MGRGEHVGWTVAAHERCRDRSLPLIPRGAWRLDEWSAALAAAVPEPYDRAAAEAAAIDLALRQRETTVFALADCVAQPVHYVVSFAQVADPAAEARRDGRRGAQGRRGSDVAGCHVRGAGRRWSRRHARLEGRRLARRPRARPPAASRRADRGSVLGHGPVVAGPQAAAERRCARAARHRPRSAAGRTGRRESQARAHGRRARAARRRRDVRRARHRRVPRRHVRARTSAAASSRRWRHCCRRTVPTTSHPSPGPAHPRRDRSGSPSTAGRPASDHERSLRRMGRGVGPRRRPDHPGSAQPGRRRRRGARAHRAQRLRQDHGAAARERAPPPERRHGARRGPDDDRVGPDRSSAAAPATSSRRSASFRI